MKNRNTKCYAFEGGPADGKSIKCAKRASGKRIPVKKGSALYHYYRKCHGVMCYQGIFTKHVDTSVKPS